jgi:hypothetical protein
MTEAALRRKAVWGCAHHSSASECPPPPTHVLTTFPTTFSFPHFLAIWLQMRSAKYVSLLCLILSSALFCRLPFFESLTHVIFGGPP